MARISEQPEKGSDFDPQVINAYIFQCTAEAQEGKQHLSHANFSLILNLRNFFHYFPVTVARAIELKHTAALVSALANETAKMFSQAGKEQIKINRKFKYCN